MAFFIFEPHSDMDSTSSVRRGDPMRAPLRPSSMHYRKKLRGVVNGYVKITITHLKTIAAILQYTHRMKESELIQDFFSW